MGFITARPSALVEVHSSHLGGRCPAPGVPVGVIPPSSTISSPPLEAGVRALAGVWGAEVTTPSTALSSLAST
eukprot:8249539-Pyramimonas_sp.AAC.1